jgi:hypothetical protein
MESSASACRLPDGVTRTQIVGDADGVKPEQLGTVDRKMTAALRLHAARVTTPPGTTGVD